jgi:hypothetical protein
MAASKGSARACESIFPRPQTPPAAPKGWFLAYNIDEIHAMQARALAAVPRQEREDAEEE